MTPTFRMLAAMGDTPRVRADRLGIALMIAGLGLGALFRSQTAATGCASLTSGSAVAFAAGLTAMGIGFARCLTGKLGRYLTILVASLSPIVLAVALVAASAAGDCG